MNPNALTLLGLIAPDALTSAKDWVRETGRKDPLDALAWLTLVGAQIFFKAEHGHNPKVRSLNDALVYVSTNLSVGYCDIFAVTDTGKQLGSFLMVVGPGLAARAFEPTQLETAYQEAEEAKFRQDMLGKLDRLCGLLERQVESSGVEATGPSTLRDA